MTDKFIHVNKETVKNGDTVYLGRDAKFLYVGEHPARYESAVIMSPSGYLTHDLYSNLEVKAPKKTVWVNVYKDGTAVWWPSKKDALLFANKDKLVDMCPLEIDDVA